MIYNIQRWESNIGGTTLLQFGSVLQLVVHLVLLAQLAPSSPSFPSFPSADALTLGHLALELASGYQVLGPLAFQPLFRQSGTALDFPIKPLALLTSHQYDAPFMRLVP